MTGGAIVNSLLGAGSTMCAYLSNHKLMCAIEAGKVNDICGALVWGHYRSVL